VQVLEARPIHHEIAVDADVVVVEFDSGDAVLAFFFHLAVTLSMALFTYLTILGFTGGAVPVLGWQLAGGLVPGLLWLGVMSTLGVVVVGVAPLLAASALARTLLHIRSR
jgi:hypothetical protein